MLSLQNPERDLLFNQAIRDRHNSEWGISDKDSLDDQEGCGILRLDMLLKEVEAAINPVSKVLSREIRTNSGR